jgi:ketosteroid isomerase-like protein
MSDTDLHSVIRDYLEAFDRRDLDRCMRFFAEDCRIDFAFGIYRGTEAIVGWHKDRFKAEMRVLRVEQIKVDGQTVVVDLVVTSEVATRWRLPTVAGRVNLVFGPGNLIRDASFGLRTAIPIEGW